MRRAARTDSNHREILDAFRRCGYSVADTSQLGDGFTDAVVARDMDTTLVEIKDGTKPPSKQKLTGDQEKFHAGWKGRIVIIRSVDDVLQFVAEQRKGHVK